jgi:C4-dicarboxylate-specific signal transduction histidine kinase
VHGRRRHVLDIAAEEKVRTIQDCRESALLPAPAHAGGPMALVGALAADLLREIQGPMAGLRPPGSSTPPDPDNRPCGQSGAAAQTGEPALRRAACLAAQLQLLAGASHAQRGAFDLAAAIADALELCRRELAHVIVTRRIKAQHALGDAGQVTQVIANLLRNAAAATRDCARPGVVHIDTQETGARVLVRILDNGTGIDARAMARAWPGGSAERARPGQGLGLPVASAIVRAHGGALGWSNRSPHGARFEFDLPVAATVPPERCHGHG